MRTVVLCLSLLTSASAFADWNSFLKTPLGGYLRAGIVIVSGSDGSSSRGGIIQAEDKDECIDKFEDSQKSWEKSNGVINAAYLRSKISSYQIESAGENKSYHNLGLDKMTKLPVNSWNSKVAPHMDSQCDQHYKVTSNFLADSGEEKCRIVTAGIESLSYNILYCEGSNHIQIDPSKTHMGEFKVEDENGLSE